MVEYKFTPEQLKEIGMRLRQLRREKDLKQHELGELFGYAASGRQTLISSLENGRVPIGRLTVDLYVKHLGASRAYILHNQGPHFTSVQRAKTNPTEAKRGNLKLVLPDSLATFHASRGRQGFTYYVHPLLNDEHVGFVLGSVPPPRLLADTLLITRLVTEDELPPLGALLVVRTAEGFEIGWLEKIVQEYLVLETATGRQSVRKLQRPYVYQTYRIDAPLGISGPTL
ncbi:hypothetical protein FAES_3304 [Fibrella aestuarina BUZ 2]|uniref:HTH cro/C1-type domain-containing protein n=1 Tax=Fibrella aestuarina BUZ 2 TaxID=1166018 RepID=I0KB09_9BACT|nr:helix-turn-helix transcriptional regulator [Fibrella aestuarina]CCH01312.1 hypothetical protein FAES_3304 [Fibrella aestuarina BUZ 2]